jgi:hypothetical protein
MMTVSVLSGAELVVVVSASNETKPKPVLVVDVAVGFVIDGEESKIPVEDDVIEVLLESEVVVVDAEVEVEVGPVGSKVNGMVVLGGFKLVVLSESRVTEEAVEDVAAA